jgi:hypothetical protein
MGKLCLYLIYFLEKMLISFNITQLKNDKISYIK